MIVAILIGSFVIIYLVVDLLSDKSSFWALYVILAMLVIAVSVLVFVMLK